MVQIADRSITIRIGANVTGLVAGLTTARKAAGDFGRTTLDSVQRNDAAISTLSSKIGLVGLGLVGVATLAVKRFADFDAAMSNVAATGDDAKASIEGLREAALDAGARTVFSATEAADAITALAKAGVKATDVLDGGLDGALNLAAAGGLDVADAAEIAATMMTQFGKSGKDVTHIADLLAAGAGKAQGEVSDMAEAMKYAGIPLAQLGVSMEETAGTIALFAKNGIIGEQAGTSLRSMISSLTSPSSMAASTMADLGIKVFDTNDKFIGMQGVAGVLAERMGDLTDAERANALGRIFGNESLQAANVLVREGAAGVAEWTTAVDDQGYAAETAAEKMNNLKGDVEALMGSLETAFIGMGEGANEPLRGLVQGLDDLVDGFNGLPDPIKQGTLALVGGGGLVLLGVAGLGKLLVSASETRTAMRDLSLTTEAARTKMSGFARTAGMTAATVAVATAAIGLLSETVPRSTLSIEELEAKLNDLADTGRDVLPVFEDISRPWLEFANPSSSLKNLDDFRSKLQQIADPNFLQAAQTSAVKFVRAWDASSLGQYAARLEQVGGQLGTLAESDLPKATDQFRAFYDAAGGDEAGGRRLLETMPAFREALIGVADDAGLATDDATLLQIALGNVAPAADEAAASATALSTEIQYVGMSTEDATKALDEWRSMVAEADASFIGIAAAYDSVIAKNEAMAQATADATDDAEDSWLDYYDGVSVSASDFIAQLQAQVDAQTAWEDNMLAITERVKTGMTGNMAEAANGMIDELLDLGPEGAAQVQLLKDMSDEEFAKVVELWSQKGTDAVSEFTTKVENYRQPVIEVTANMSAAYLMVDRFIRDTNGRKIGLNAAGNQISVQMPDGRNAYRDGGYTGDAPTDAIAGYVHGKEFVVNAVATARNRPQLEAMNRGLPGYAGGGYVTPRPMLAPPMFFGSSPSGSGAQISLTVQADGALAAQQGYAMGRQATIALQDALATHSISTILTGG